MAIHEHVMSRIVFYSLSTLSLLGLFLIVIHFGLYEEASAYEERVTDGKTLSSQDSLPDCHYYNWSIIQEMRTSWGTITNQEYQSLIKQLDTSCEYDE